METLFAILLPASPPPVCPALEGTVLQSSGGVQGPCGDAASASLVHGTLIVYQPGHHRSRTCASVKSVGDRMVSSVHKSGNVDRTPPRMWEARGAVVQCPCRAWLGRQGPFWRSGVEFLGFLCLMPSLTFWIPLATPAPNYRARRVLRTAPYRGVQESKPVTLTDLLLASLLHAIRGSNV
ncbi:hypothetical protein B0H13DRAFT_2553511 [Mycena leptocephala]|nr:hypothetical protein B0H13DRAFT_2553511 [Mycena leptocephala]